MINKIFKLNFDYVTCVNNYEPILILISKIKRITYKEIRKIIYEMILYLIDQYYGKKIKKRNDNEKARIQNKILEKEKK